MQVYGILEVLLLFHCTLLSYHCFIRTNDWPTSLGSTSKAHDTALVLSWLGDFLENLVACLFQIDAHILVLHLGVVVVAVVVVVVVLMFLCVYVFLMVI